MAAYWGKAAHPAYDVFSKYKYSLYNEYLNVDLGVVFFFFFFFFFFFLIFFCHLGFGVERSDCAIF